MNLIMQLVDKYHDRQNIKFINTDEAKLQGEYILVHLLVLPVCSTDLLHTSVESRVADLEDSEEIHEQGEYLDRDEWEFNSLYR